MARHRRSGHTICPNKQNAKVRFHTETALVSMIGAKTTSVPRRGVAPVSSGGQRRDLEGGKNVVDQTARCCDGSVTPFGDWLGSAFGGPQGEGKSTQRGEE
jgi:hypothetical protein